jgi:hypothetical protein
MCLVKTPKPPPPPPKPPSPEDAALAAERERARRLRSRGYASTILTSGLGLGDLAPVAQKTLLGQ